MVTKEDIMGKLSLVTDPELGINIVELGLVYGVNVLEKEAGRPQRALVTMTFTTPACPLINEILNEVKERLGELPDADIEVTVVFDPPWTPDRMSEKAKVQLGML